MTRLPLTVIGGYLGAGKTTLINRLLALDHGLRLAVLVNDFGAINIDAALLKSAREDTIELTNGCVCCTMSGDLFFAIGDMLDRNPRPDHLIVEASGIADPAKIAAVASGEKDLRYAGILTVVDGESFATQVADDRIADQLKAQLQCADFLVLSKAFPGCTGIDDALVAASVERWISADEPDRIAALLFDPSISPSTPRPARTRHPAYVQWSDPTPPNSSRAELEARLARRPSGLLRLKGIVPDSSGRVWEVHVVGRRTEIELRPSAETVGLVAVGQADAVTREEVEDWWTSWSPSDAGGG